MPTYTQLQTSVQTNVIDLPTAVTTLVPSLLNYAQRELQTRHDFKVCEALSSVFTTTEHTRVLGSVPSDWMKWRGKPELLDADGKVRTLAVLPSRQEAERLYGTTAGGEATEADLAGEPRGLILGEPSSVAGAMSFEVFPLPDENSLYANGNYRIRVPYFKYLPALSAGSDTNWFTENADEWLIYRATAEAFFANWDSPRGTEWLQRAADRLQLVIKRDKMMRISQVNALVVYPRAHGPRYPGSDVG